MQSGSGHRSIVFSLSLFLFLSVLFSLPGGACAKGAAVPRSRQIVGFWLTQKGDAQVQFYSGGQIKGRPSFLGRLAWLRQPNDDNGRPALDDNNPNPALRSHPILGLVIIHAVYRGGGQWEGTVYDPDNGKTYSCSIRLAGPDTMKMRGYLGFSLFGRTETWKRVKGNS